MPRATSLPSIPALSWDDSRLLVESIVDYAIFLLDTEGFVASWSRGAENIQGYTAEEIVGQHFSRFYPPGALAEGQPERELAVARKVGRVEDEGWRLRKDGTRFWANVVITALRDERGRIRGFGKVVRDLTARRAAEEQLRRSEERFRLLVENVGDYAIYMLDTEGRVSTWNLGAERMKGYRAEEVLGSHFERFFPPEDVLAGKPARELELARTLGRFEDEGWRIRKDGSRFWANAVLTPLRDARGDLLGYAKITRDLTVRREAEQNERKLLRERSAREVAEHAEDQIRESEEKFRSLNERLEIVFEGVADGITVQDRSGRVVFANTAAAKICGFQTPTDLIQASPEDVTRRFEILTEDGRPFDVEDLPARRVLNGRPGGNAVLHVRERSTERDWWVLLRASAVLDTFGEPELAINIWHDISAERTHEVRARYLAEVSAVLTGSLVVDEMVEGLARTLVPGLADWCSIYLRRGDGLRQGALAHIDPGKAEAAREYRRRFPAGPENTAGVWHALQTGDTVVENEIDEDVLARSTSDPAARELLRTMGLRAGIGVPIRARGRVLGVLVLAFTETDRKFDAGSVALAEEIAGRAGIAVENAELYQEAQAAAIAADEASRAKDEFLATVSHELRTPLSAILGWASVLKGRVKDPTIARPVEVIHRNAQAQVKLIEDILDVSRVIIGKFRLDLKPTDLIAVVRDAVEVVRPSASAKQITLRFSSHADFCLLVADAERLQQAVWNLLSNSVKFTDAGGSVDIAVHQEGSEVSVEVRDTGRGIEPEFLPAVFDRFKQADATTTRRVGGLGLGLALVRHIVELHGGRVVASSEGLGKGSTFTLTLPVRAIIPDQPIRDTAPARESAPRRFGDSSLPPGARVLVVDDERDARELLSEVLLDAGAEVCSAASAAEAMEFVHSFRPDVIVSDIGMPGEDGYSFIARVRALPPHRGGRTPSIALTAFVRNEDRNRALSAGHTAHIGKPVDPRALLAQVAELARSAAS